MLICEFVIVELMRMPDASLNNQQSKFDNSFLPSPFTASPIIPDSESLEEFDGVRVAHRLLNLVMGEARPDVSRQIREFDAQRRCLGDVFF